MHFYENGFDIPEHLKDYYLYSCTDIREINPSDHNPILSCVEFDCQE